MSLHSELCAPLLIAYVTLVAIIDVRTHRIPNALTATAAVLGLSLQVWIHGWTGLAVASGGIAVGLGMLLPFYMLRAFGAGDVKAMATVGIFLGAQLTWLAVALTLIAGAIIGVIVLLLSCGPLSTLYRVAGVAAAPLSSLRDGQGAGTARTRRFAYGGAIAIGTFATLFASIALQLPF
jgi:prepilin peptidase CpaA